MGKRGQRAQHEKVSDMRTLQESRRSVTGAQDRHTTALCRFRSGGHTRRVSRCVDAKGHEKTAARLKPTHRSFSSKKPTLLMNASEPHTRNSAV